MKNIVLLGDSITDMTRSREYLDLPYGLGTGYAFLIESVLATKYPMQYKVYNRGISGNRIVDVYARIKADCINLKPDVVSVLIGVNDVWHEIDFQNGVELDRFDRVYRMMLDDIKKYCGDIPLIIVLPFILKGSATEACFDKFSITYEYAQVAEKIGKDYGASIVYMQEIMDEWAKKTSPAHILFDGVHPSVAGSKLICDEWIKAFEKDVMNKI